MPLVEAGHYNRKSTHTMARAFSEASTATTHFGRQLTHIFDKFVNNGGEAPSLAMFNAMAMLVDEGYVGADSAKDQYPWMTTSLDLPPAHALVIDTTHCYVLPETHASVNWELSAEPGCAYGDQVAGPGLLGLIEFNAQGELEDPGIFKYCDQYLKIATYMWVRDARACISLAQDTDGHRLGFQFMGMPGGPGGPLDKKVSQILLVTPSERWMKDGDLACSSLGVEGLIRARETHEHWLAVVGLKFYLNYGTPCSIGEGSLVEEPRHLEATARRVHEMFDRTRGFAARAERGDDSKVRVQEREVTRAVRDALVARSAVPADVSDEDLTKFVAALPNVHVDCLSLCLGQWYRVFVFDGAGNLVKYAEPQPLPRRLLNWPPPPPRVDASFIDLGDEKYRGPVLDDAALRVVLRKNESCVAIRARGIDGVCRHQLTAGISCRHAGGAGECGYKFHFDGIFGSNERRLARDGACDLCVVCGWPFTNLTTQEVTMGGGNARCQNEYCQRDNYLDVIKNAEETGGELPTHWNTRDDDRSVARRLADAKAARVGTPAANAPPQELLARVNERAALVTELTRLNDGRAPEEGMRLERLRNMLDKKKAGVGGTKKGDRVVVLENDNPKFRAYAGRTGVVKKVKSSGGWRDVRFDGEESVTGVQDKCLRKITAAAPAPASADMEL